MRKGEQRRDEIVKDVNGVGCILLHPQSIN